MVGIFLGINKWGLGGVLRALVLAPLDTLGSLYDKEMEFHGQLRHEAALVRSLPRARKSDWTRKQGFAVRLFIFASVETIAFYYAGFEMEFGLCSICYWWFTIMMEFGA